MADEDTTTENYEEDEDIEEDDYDPSLELGTDYKLNEDTHDIVLTQNMEFVLSKSETTRKQRFLLACDCPYSPYFNTIGIADDLSSAATKEVSVAIEKAKTALKKLINEFQTLDTASLELETSNTSGNLEFNFKVTDTANETDIEGTA